MHGTHVEVTGLRGISRRSENDDFDPILTHCAGDVPRIGEEHHRFQVIEYLWQVAYANGQLGAHENHLISKIAGLLHVTHGHCIAAKLHAKQAAQQRE
ncbi:TerB family tellurite resistance protein [Rhodoferax sp.]|uniref:tellurite resistance TerB family protein n=1 Tax=Rhodoferax sp. TaxID=50421 RepID=UPI0025DD4616|nr:TerB family tellurite resistance protein [Rhodoferax sp.]